MSGQDLFNDLQKKQSYADQALKQLSTRGKEYAEAERAYKVTLAQTMLKLRDEGEKTTTLKDIAYGDRQVSDLRMQRDIAEAMYKSAQEALNLYKLQIRVLQGQLDKEWSNEK